MEEVKDFLRSRTPCNLLMVAANILVFIVLEMLGNTENVTFMAEHGACYSPWVMEYGEYYRLFTSMFLHFGISHLFNNMVVLLFLGDALEQAAGKIRYLIIYLGGGIAANVVSCLVDYKTGDFAVSAGASGAVFAVVGALIYIVLRNRGRVQEFTLKRLALMAVLTLFQGFTSAGVDNAAHIGGFVAGFLLAVLLYRKPKTQKMEFSW
jgi:rhomboid protease GluP